MIEQGFCFDEMSPDAVLADILHLTEKTVYITENGCCCDNDLYCIRYMALHYAAFRNAIDLGVDLRGVFHSSLMENWEWGTYAPRLGLVDVDRKTFQRTPKPSARIYKQIIANNGFSGEKLVNQGNINPFINK
jgi:beta-glucosidase